MRNKPKFAAIAAACLAVQLSVPMVSAASEETATRPTTHRITASAENVRWGNIGIGDPVLTVDSGDIVTVETVTHHSGDDYERMIKGDIGVEDIYHWTETEKNVPDRGPGVHILTGPIAVKGAEPGDVLEVRILDMRLRPNGNADYAGKTFGSNAAANWGYLYGDMVEEPKKREVITIYELDTSGAVDYATALYSYRWTTQTDPSGTAHPTIDYPGVVVDPESIERNFDFLEGVKVPVRLHFGTMGVAPKEADIVDSVPPSYFGGNIDDWRVTEGATMYYPVAVEGALLSVGDPHAGQGDSEMSGTAIETSLTGDIQIILHKKNTLNNKLLDLDFPLLENEDEWVVHGFSYANHLAELGDNAQKEIFNNSSVDKALKDAAYKTRRFLMNGIGMSEDEAYSLMSVSADFGITQVVDGNWGVHATIKKSQFDTERKLVSLREAFEELGAEVKWDASSKTVMILYNGNVLEVAIGAMEGTFNGITKKITGPVLLIDGTAQASSYFVEFYKGKLSIS